jgi:hypothetical protein
MDNVLQNKNCYTGLGQQAFHVFATDLLTRKNHGHCSTLFCDVVCRSIKIIEISILDTGKKYVFKYSN